LNKKKKVTGITNQDTNVSMKKSTDNEPKSFRSTYEPYPEEAPWSSKTTKSDDITSRLYTKPSITNDPTKRISPLVHDTKSYASGLTSKRGNLSDDDDFMGKQKSKVKDFK
jgi:hypothetical protein